MIIQQLINGLALGMTYALIAVGFSLVFGILRLVNFSHGAMYAFGAMMALMFFSFVNVWLAILLSIVLTGVTGVVIDKVALAPLRKKKSIPIAGLITTIGVAHIIQNLLTIWFGSQTRAFPSLIDLGMVDMFGTRIDARQLMVFVVSLILMGILTLIINKTKIGLAMRAVEQNTKAASLMGVNVNLIITFTFFLAGVSAAIAGGLIASTYNLVFPMMGFMAGLKGFSAAVLGGVGSLPGSIIGGLIVGVSEAMAVVFFGSAFRDSMAFIILVLVLIIRPTGIFGKKAIVKV
jgi:branched-chain amino acid transport system permease protein